MSTTGKRTLLITVGLLVIAALIIPRILSSNNTAGGRGTSSTAGSREGGIEVQVDIVHEERIGGSISTVGSVLSNEEVEIRTQVAGKIDAIHFVEGGKVAKGDLLLKINDDELRAQLFRGESRLAIAEQQAERQRQLFDKHFISELEYNNAVNELNVVKAEVQLIKAQIDKTEIRAPFNGTIGLRFVSEGSYVSPTTVITTLQDNSRMKVDFTIPEKHASRVKVGGKVNFTVQTRPERFEGTVYSFDARIDQTTRTLRVRAIAPNPRGMLLPGSFANVEVMMSERSSLTIPAFAVIPELKGHKVFVCSAGKAEPRTVEIGMRTEESVEVLSGLQAGDSLITSGILQLRPGMPVRVAQKQSADVQ